ncbi:MAG: putative periplasmic trehalase [Candidatus Saccharibacteria bacterium]|nr:putative periplasmic trehalase [Candidatus Saccharibacteria bacterium]
MVRKIPKIPLKIPQEEAIKSALLNTAGALLLTKESPDDALGELFSAVQKSKVYGDGQTFVDLMPREKMKQIRKEYEVEKSDPNFDLKAFVNERFYSVDQTVKEYHSDPNHTPRQHIKELWKVLERRNRRDKGSLIAIPYKYVVPGGRFTAQYYWDTYFTMLGLAADHRWDLVDGMIKNCAYLIRKFGFIPNGNRTYFLSRSHPPFFSHMVKLVARHQNRTLTLLEYLHYMLTEYRFWMKGRRTLSKLEETAAMRRVVRMNDGSMLARYFDNKTTPRPESLREDIATAVDSNHNNSEKLYLDLRAGAESGWDFSSRWFTDPYDISTIHTTDIIPIDLNCLLYHHELTIAETYQSMSLPLLARKYLKLAEHRKAAIQKYMWDEREGFYMDYNFRVYRHTGRVTIAGAFALYCKIATQAQANTMAQRIEKDFLKEGGLVTTLIDSGQQWDSPNGWAPMQWITIQGLREYGHHDLADRIKTAWVKTCVDLYEKEGKMVEKYNVVRPDKRGGGGEYVLQDGFGWTNGVLAALLDEDEKPRGVKK